MLQPSDDGMVDAQGFRPGSFYSAVVEDCYYFYPMPVLAKCGLPKDTPGLDDAGNPLRQRLASQELAQAHNLMTLTERDLAVCSLQPSYFGCISIRTRARQVASCLIWHGSGHDLHVTFETKSWLVPELAACSPLQAWFTTAVA